MGPVLVRLSLSIISFNFFFIVFDDQQSFIVFYGFCPFILAHIARDLRVEFVDLLEFPLCAFLKGLKELL